MIALTAAALVLVLGAAPPPAVATREPPSSPSFGPRELSPRLAGGEGAMSLKYPSPRTRVLARRRAALLGGPSPGTGWGHAVPPLSPASRSRAVREEVTLGGFQGGVLGAMAGTVVSAVVDAHRGHATSGGVDLLDPNPQFGPQGRFLATSVFAGWALGSALGTHLAGGGGGDLGQNLISTFAVTLAGIAVVSKIDAEQLYLPFAAFQVVLSSGIEWQTMPGGGRAGRSARELPEAP